MAADTGPIVDSSRIYNFSRNWRESVFADKRIFEINLDKYDSPMSLFQMRKDFTDIYAATDEKFDEKFNSKLINKIRLKQKQRSSFFTLVINIQNQ